MERKRLIRSCPPSQWPDIPNLFHCSSGVCSSSWFPPYFPFPAAMRCCRTSALIISQCFILSLPLHSLASMSIFLFSIFRKLVEITLLFVSIDTVLLQMNIPRSLLLHFYATRSSIFFSCVQYWRQGWWFYEVKEAVRERWSTRLISQLLGMPLSILLKSRPRLNDGMAQGLLASRK